MLSTVERTLTLLRQTSRLLSLNRPYSDSTTTGPIHDSQVKENKTAAPPSLPTEADVVVIGGGSIGCHTLYHLTKYGVTNAVLLERNKLTSGTTWHTAGLLWRLRPSDVDIQLVTRTHELLNTIEDETGINPGWLNNGGISVATTKEKLQQYQREATLGTYFGVEYHVLSPPETKQLFPLMNVEDIYATVYTPGDGNMNPAEFCTALTRAATNSGTKVIQNCPVEDILTETNTFGTKQVSAVVTQFGTINTKCIVNATGAWAPAVGAMAGIYVPQIGLKHAYFVTEKIPGIENMPNVKDSPPKPAYIKIQGNAVCVGGFEPKAIFLDNVEKDFSFGLYELDWDVFSVHFLNGINRIPALEQVGIRSTICGPESFTADHKPIIGEDPGCRGFYHGSGLNSAGMMYGGGYGQQLAQWIVNGSPDLDMFSCDIRRFCPKTSRNQVWLRERTHEEYAKHYDIAWPRDEHLSGRNMKLDPFHKILEERGCVYQERMGWERPGWFSKSGSASVKSYDWYGAYDDVPKHATNEYADMLSKDYKFDFSHVHEIIGEECLACRQRAALFNMTSFGKFYMTGPDSQAACNWIFTNNVDVLPGNTVYTCMLNKKAGIEGDLTVSVLEPGEGRVTDPQFQGRGFYLVAGAATVQYVWSHLMSVIHEKNFNVTLEDKTEDMGILSIQGPRSREILECVSSKSTDFSNTSFPFSTHKMVDIAGNPCRALRLSYVGELGWELHIPNEYCLSVYQALQEAGKKYGLVDAGLRAMDSLSIEKGYRHWHADIRSEDTPLEAGMTFICKLKTDTPFLGRQALEGADGLKKRLVCFTLEEKRPLWGSEVIWRGEEMVGFIRRADYAYTLDKTIGYGYVTKPKNGELNLKYLRDGEYYVESMGTKYKAKLHTISPFDPKHKRIMGRHDEQLPVVEKPDPPKV